MTVVEPEKKERPVIKNDLDEILSTELPPQLFRWNAFVPQLHENKKICNIQILCRNEI